MHGVVLSKALRPIRPADRTFLVFRKLIRAYLTSPARHWSLTLSTPRGIRDITTNYSGEFRISVFPDELDELSFFYRGIPVPFLQDYPRYFPNRNEADYLLISDIDDTVLVSRSARLLSRLWLILFHAVSKRKVVLETATAYQHLAESRSVDFAYVSGSESNLFHLIAAFFMHNKLPEAPLFLRPHVTWRELLQRPPRKAHKLTHIRQLIEAFPQKRILLFGDDSQQDHTIFKQLTEEFPERVEAAFIRQTGLNRHFQTEQEFGNTHTNWYYYNSFEQVRGAIENLLT